MANDIYSEPFLSYWPIPLSFKECFRSNKITEKNLNLKKNSTKNYFTSNKKEVRIKAFWNVLFSPLGFSA